MVYLLSGEKEANSDPEKEGRKYNDIPCLGAIIARQYCAVHKNRERGEEESTEKMGPDIHCESRQLSEERLFEVEETYRTHCEHVLYFSKTWRETQTLVCNRKV